MPRDGRVVRTGWWRWEARSAEASCHHKLPVLGGCWAEPGWTAVVFRGDAGSSKGGYVIDFSKPWIMIPSDFLHCLLFPKFMGHLGTSRHIVHLLACGGVCPLYSTVKPHKWRTVCSLLRRREQILTVSVSIHLLLGTCSILVKRNLTSLI